MPVSLLEQYLTFSLEDWQNVQVLKKLTQAFQVSKNPQALQDFFVTQTADDLVKYAVHWPLFEEIYREPVFEVMWQGACITHQPPFDVTVGSCCYYAYKQQLIQLLIDRVKFPDNADLDTSERKFYFVAVDCLLKQMRAGCAVADSESTIRLFFAMRDSVGYLGCLLVAEIYLKIANLESDISFAATNPSAFFGVTERKEASPQFQLVLSAIQLAYIHLSCAKVFLDLQHEILFPLYLAQIENTIQKIYHTNLDGLIAVVHERLPASVRAQTQGLLEQHQAEIIRQLFPAAEVSQTSDLTRAELTM